ncbi:MAG: hypothetical protein ACEPOZ_08470 [Marinifilaceae bacterium]
MANIDDYQAVVNDLENIPEKDVKEPSMPVDTAVQEAENLYEWCQDDKPQLQAAGLPLSTIDAIPVRAGACRYAQSLWMKEFNDREKDELEWKELSPKAYNLKGVILHNFRYAFRNDDGLMSQVNRIAEGSGHADMIQDLSDLALLGKAHPEPLQAVGFDLGKLDLSEDLSDRLASLLAKVNGTKGNHNPSKEMRDRAFTYLKQAVDEVRECGKFVFWQNEIRLRGYRSAYFRKRTTRAKKAEMTE